MTENLSDISNKSLVSHLKQLVSHERELQLEILSYLKEIYERRLYLEKGYPSLFAFLTEELGYSEGAAGRRIRAMKLMEEVPEAKEKLETGALSITVASQIQSFVQSENKKRKTKKALPLTSAQKLDLVNQLEGTSSRTCEEKLAAIAPETVIPREQTRILTPEKSQIQFVASQSLLEKLEKLKNLTSHTNPERKYETLFEKLADMALEKLDPERRVQRRMKRNSKQFKKPQAQSQPSSSLIHSRGNGPVRSQWPAIVGKALVQPEQKNPDLAPATSAQKFGEKAEDPMSSTSAQKLGNQNLESILRTSAPKLGNRAGGKVAEGRVSQASLGETKLDTDSSSLGSLPLKKGLKRHVPAPLRDYIWQRDQGKCQYKNKQSGEICGSKQRLELDHVFPFSWGGGHASDNLRLLCHRHHLLYSKKYFAWENN